MITESKIDVQETTNIENVMEEFKNYIQSSASVFLDFQKTVYESTLKDLDTKNLLKDFLTDQKMKLLYFIVDAETEEIKIINKMIDIKNGTGLLYFKKKDLILEQVSNFKKYFRQSFHLLNIQEINTDFNPTSIARTCLKNGLQPILKDISRINNSSNISKESIIKKEDDSFVKVVEKKFDDLDILLIRNNSSNEVPQVQLIYDEVIKKLLREENTSELTIDKVPSNLINDANFLAGLLETVNKWGKLTSILIFHSNDTVFDSVENEIEYWKTYYQRLQELEKQLKSPEALLTLEIIKNKKKFHKKNDLADELNLSNKIEQVKSILDILKEIDVSSIQNSIDLTELSQNMMEIFSHIKKLFNNFNYPANKCMKTLENFSHCLTNRLIELFSAKDIMHMDFEEFTELQNSLKKNISHVWNNQINIIKEYFNQNTSLDKTRLTSFVYKMSHSKFHDRIKHLHEYRARNEEIKKIIKEIYNKDDPLYINLKNIKFVEEKEIQDKFEKFINSCNIFDLSKPGKAVLQKALAEYNSEINSVEKDIIMKIRDLLGSTKGYNEMFKVFTRFSNLMKKTEVKAAIQEYQNQLLKKVQDNTNELFLKYKKSFSNSGGVRIAKFYDMLDISGNYIWTEQISEHIQNNMKDIEIILGENYKSTPKGQEIVKFYENFKKMKEKKGTSDKFEKSEINLEGPLLSLDVIHRNNTLKLVVNFSEENENKIIELRNLINKKDYFQSTLSKKYYFKRNAWPVYINALRLIETVKIWNYLIPKIDEKMTNLLANQLKKVYIQIEKGISKYDWNHKDHGDTDYQKYFFNFYEAVQDLEVATDYLFEKITVIENLVKNLNTCNNDFGTFSDILNQIQEIIDELLLKEYTHIEFLVNEINEKIEKVFIKRLTENLTLWVDEFSKYKHSRKLRGKNKHIKDYTLHEIQAKNKKIFIEPPIQQAREFWLANLHNNIHMITCQKKMKVNRYNILVEKEEASNHYFADLLEKISNNLLSSAYRAINHTINEAEAYVKKWLSYQALWDIKIEDFYTRFGDDLNTWQIVLNEIKLGRTTFDTSNFINNFGPIVVNYKNVQLKINNLYDSLHKNILNEFGIKFTKSCDNIMKEITEQQEKMENINFNNPEELVENISTLNFCKAQMNKWESDVQRCQENEKLLQHQKYHFDEHYKGADKLEADFKRFKQICNYKSNMFNSNMDMIVQSLSNEEEVLMKKLNEIENVWNNKKPFTSDLAPEEALEVLKSLEKMIFENKSKLEKLNKAKELLKLESIDLDLMNNIISETNTLREIWSALHDLWIPVNELMDSPFEVSNNITVTKTFDKILDAIGDLKPEFKNHDIFVGKKEELRELKKKNRLIKDLKSEAIKEHHFKEILQIINLDKPAGDILLGDLFKMNILSYEKKIAEIVSHAQGELVLETMLNKIMEYWNHQEFDTSNYQKKIMLIRGWDEQIERAGEDSNQLESMTLSQHYNAFESEIKKWQNKIQSVSNTLEIWMDVQRKWVYLEGIFLGSSDIKEQLGIEYERFMKVDHEFKSIMKQMVSKQTILDCVIGIPNLYQTLQLLMDTLEKIQKSLSDYLETQRQAFSRFYFVGDEDLLEIIGNSKQIGNIQKYFSKMFAGINSIDYEEKEGAILLGMASQEDEKVKFDEKIKINDYPKINLWLLKMEEQMQTSLATLLEKSIEAWKGCETNKMREVVEKFPTQIGLVGFQTFWTYITEENIINSINTGDIEKKIINYLSYMAEEVLNKLPKLTRLRYQQLITEMVHKRDVSRYLSKIENLKLKDFDWQYYMRYYLKIDEPVKKERLRVKDGNSEFLYSYEYLGITDKLVQTPLTDKCYLTLTQALHLRMGGAPFGPAGTGKTESVKMLGNCLGRFVLVFNCDENFNLKAMGRIFIGLCQVGAWGCFDEFNRLEEIILSAVSQDILSIQLGLREGISIIDLMNKRVTLSSNMGIFVTMNPGYAGRSNLPENLKQLFRQMAMIKPDSILIAQVMLFSQGFKSAEELSGKVVALFELCSDQLSSQPHYDFGLRALKSVLTSAGNLKRKILVNEEVKDPHSLEEEQKIILRSFCDTVVPKLISDDTPLLRSLIQGVFPSSSIPPIEDAELFKILPEECRRRFLLFNNEKFVEKVLQLSQILKLHHGVMLVGPTGCGKSAAWNTLLSALTLVDGIKAEKYVIDPKAISKDDLYGKLDNTTMEWTDGIFTYILRKIIENQRGEKSKRHWIVFDGDVDPEWAENLNSVLDNNKLLTLPNGERLSIPSNVKILFEVESLKYATLATVSRCGMVWFSEDILQNKHIYHHYIERLKEDNYDSLLKIQGSENEEFKSIREMCVDAILPIFGMNTNEESFADIALKISETENHCMVFSRIRVLEALFALIRKGVSKVVEKHETSFGNYTQSIDIVKKFMINWCIFAINWSFVGDLKLYERSEYFLKLQSAIVHQPEWLVWPEIHSSVTLIDYQVRIEDGSYNLWKNNVPIIDVSPEKVTSADLIITTVDTLRHQEVLCSWLLEHRPFLICGPPGSGKTMTLMSTLKNLQNFEMIFVNFSSSTSPKLILQQFEHYCEYFKSGGSVILRPRQPNKWLVVFCDEINLPDEDKYGTQIIITFLRQLTEQHGFWRCSDKTWITLERIQFVGACNPPTDAGRHPLAQRFLRHTPLILVDFPGYDSLIQIYGTFNRGMLKRNPALKPYSDTLTKAMVDYYSESQKRFTSDQQPHYIYSPRELTRWKYAINQALECVNSLEDLVRLWAHEALRLFEDRLVTDDEKKWCQTKIDEISTEVFPGVGSKCLERPIIYSTYITKNYQSVGLEDLRSYVLEKLKTFNEEVYDVQLVVFDQVLEHIIKIDRVLKQPIGHLLLVGASGVGKTTLSRFVSWINGLKVFQIKAGRNYSIENFDVDLRNIMKRAGCKMEKITFIFDESNVISVAFLERMNALLASGEIPGLFEGEELVSLLNTYKEAMGSGGKSVNETDEEIYHNFTKNVQQNLHVVFTMNPANPDFSNRTASSPAIFNRCVIDWFGDWPESALYQVAKELTANFDYKHINHNILVELIVRIHKSVCTLNQKLRISAKKFNYMTPRDYIDFIRQFLGLLEEKNNSLKETQKHLNNGLEALKETENSVLNLKKELTLFDQQLELKDKEAQEKMENIVLKKKEAKEEIEKSEILKKDIEKSRIEAKTEEDKINAELSDVEPTLKRAEEAVGAIKSTQINEVRGYKNVSEYIELCISGVLSMIKKKKKKSTWDECKKEMGDKNFLKNVLFFDKETLTQGMIDYIKADYLNNPKWNVGLIDKSSRAAGPLAIWLESIVKYGEIYSQVEPMREKIAELKKKGDELEQTKIETEKKIVALESNIKDYTEQYAKLIVEKQKLETDKINVSSKTTKAEDLLMALSSERVRWGNSSKEFESQFFTLTGDVLLSAGFLTYNGFFDQFYRSLLIETWKGYLSKSNFPFKKELSLIEFLSLPNERILWQSRGLPSDDLCIQNAIILKRFNRYPLIIDPAGQAMDFMKNLYKDGNRELNCTSFADGGFMKNLEKCLRFGLPILIKDVEKIEPILNSVLNKEIIKDSGRVLIRVGDQEIDFAKDFKLFMITRNSDAQFTPDLCSRVTFANFTVTKSSLENQFINIYVKNERPDTEHKRLNLLKLQGEFLVKLRLLEEDLLNEISSSRGSNLLENDEMIQKLKTIKTESNDIEEQMSRSESVLEEILEVTNQYKPIATISSNLYFLLKKMNTIEVMYQYSLKFYMKIVTTLLHSNKQLKEVPKDEYEERIKVIESEIFIRVYDKINNSVLENHKLFFSVRFAQVKILSTYGQKMFDLFTLIFSPCKLIECSLSSSLLDGALERHMLLKLEDLSKQKGFSGLIDHLERNKKAWLAVIKDPNCTDLTDFGFINFEELGFDFSDNTKQEEIAKEIVEIIIFNIIKPEKAIRIIRIFVDLILGKEFMNSSFVNLELSVMEDADNKSPVLFASAPGFDPSSKIYDLAKRLNQKYTDVAIGSAEGNEQALNSIEHAVKTGSWVILKNVHLAPTSWLNVLEQKIYDANSKPNFRIFLLSEFTEKIPVTLLRQSVKFIFELPDGVIQSVKRTYNTVFNAERSNKNPPERCRLHFLLAWIHAVIMERLRYTPTGWSKKYEFSEADQLCALEIIDQYVDLQGARQNLPLEHIPFIALRSIITNNIYGGKIDNAFDLKILKSIVDQYMTVESFNPNEVLIQDKNVIVKNPDAVRHEEFKKWIETLDETETPTWAGLPSSADDLLKIKKLENLLFLLSKVQDTNDQEIENLDEMQKTDSGTTKMKWMSEVGERTKIFYEILPQFLNKLERDENLISNPLFRFLDREISLSSNLLNDVRKSLKGVIDMTECIILPLQATKKLSENIMKNEIPNFWKKYKVHDHLGLSDWIKDFKNRISQLIPLSTTKEWQRKGINLGQFLFPEAFLTATRQFVAQKNKVSMDELEIKISFSDKDLVDEDSFLVNNLWIEGVKWTKEGLFLTDDMSHHLHKVQFKWQKSNPQEIKETKEGEIFVPLYLNSSRQNLILSIKFDISKSNISEKTLYQRGIAFIAWNLM